MVFQRISLQEEHNNTRLNFTFLHFVDATCTQKIDIYPNLFWWPEVATVNWSFLLLWPSQRTLYISARLIAPEIRQNWSRFIAARRSLPPKTDAGQIVWWCYQKEMTRVKFSEYWKFALFVLILSVNWNVAHWTLFLPTDTSHCTIKTNNAQYSVCNVHTAHSAQCTMQCTMHTEHIVVHTADCTLCGSHYKLNTAHCIYYT